MTSVVLEIPNISCGHCEQTITRVLTAQPGVERVRVDIPSKRVSLEYDETKVDLEHLKQILDEEDYPVAAVTNP